MRRGVRKSPQNNWLDPQIAFGSEDAGAREEKNVSGQPTAKSNTRSANSVELTLLNGGKVFKS